MEWNTVHKRRCDHVDHLYYGCLLSNISTYHLKVASRPVDWKQWNRIQCTRGDMIMYYECLLSNISLEGS